MDLEQRNNRLRQLIRKVNQRHKKQAKQIDILCNDFVAAQRDFIKKLDSISFSAYFYRAIVGKTDLNSLLHTAGKVIKKEIGEGNAAFFLRNGDSFELHSTNRQESLNSDRQRLEECFTKELVDNVCRSNRICDLDFLVGMGLQGNPVMLKKISAATVPLSRFGASVGFVLIYRSSSNAFSEENISCIAAIMPGLSEAIGACPVFSQAVD